MDVTRPVDRRTVTRLPGHTFSPVRVRIESNEADLVVGVWDISVMGIGLLAPIDLQPGTRVLVQPARENQRLPEDLVAQVRHTSRTDERGYLVGCSFSRALTTDDVMALS